MERGGLKVAYVDLVAKSSVWRPRPGEIRLWMREGDGGLYAEDEAGSNTQIIKDGALATGNSQYNWDWFENGTGLILPEFSVVRLQGGGVDDGKLKLSDNDAAGEDMFFGLTYDGATSVTGSAKVIYSGKVPGAVAGLGLDSNTVIWMSNEPGQFTHIMPNFQVSNVFQIGITRGDDLYLRPILRSEL